MADLDGIDVVILAGGLGTRIRAVLGDTPKVLAPVAGRPFLDHLIDRLAAAGAGRVVLSLGHLAGRVLRHLEQRDEPLPVLAVVEPRPMGTGGALRLTLPRLGGGTVLVMNGDTWVDADLGTFLADHRQAGRAVSLLCVEVPDCARYGRVVRAPDGGLARFVEKDPDYRGAGLINGGIYLFEPAALALLAGLKGEAPSLERDFLATLPEGAIHCHVARGATFIDIGTPESLGEADSVVG